MIELRERIASEVPSNCEGIENGCEGHCVNCSYSIANAAIALIPKPTVTLVCDKCGGSGIKCDTDECDHWRVGVLDDACRDNCGYSEPCPHCTDGKVEHLIEWEKPLPACGPYSAKLHTTLTLPDLLDADVAQGYWIFHHRLTSSMMKSVELPNNKGVLRIGLVVKEGV